LEIFDADTGDVAITLNNIGLCYARLGNPEKAHEIYSKCR
jgi:Tfp pilus assembly protein PilF